MLRSATVFVAAVVLLFTTSCDFNAASDAVDDFDVIVEVPPLTTVVSLQALNASNGEPITRDVRVTFEGPDAAEVIDVYSDPLSEIVLRDGFGNFGVDSTRNPAPENPVQLTLRVRAQGFNTTSTSVRVSQEGTLSKVVRLTPDNPNNSAEGSSGRRRRVNVQNGATNNTVTVETAPTSDAPDAAQASASIPAGTQLRTAGGEPLQGSVNADLSVFDNSADAQELLPTEAVTNEEGQRRRVRGAVRFQVREDRDGGRIAGQLGTAGQDTTRMTAVLPALNTDAGTPVITLVDPETGTARTFDLESSSSARAVRAKQTGETTFFFTGSEVLVISPEGTTTIDLSEFSGEFFAAVGIEPTEANSCTPNATLEIDPNGHSGSFGLRLSGNGFALDTEVKIPSSGNLTISAQALAGTSIPQLGDVTLTVRTPDDQEVTTTVDLCSGTTYQVTNIPAPQTDRINATVRVDPNCPEGERLPITPPLDGYNVAYRVAGSSEPYRVVPQEDITINVSDDAKQTIIDAVVPVSGVLPSTDYNFIGTFDNESTSRNITMPAQAGGEVVFMDDELREECN